jgi:hypothetical protein
MALLLTAFGCNTQPPGPPALAEVFAGPSSLPIRQDIALNSAVQATVNHGERLEVLQRRRRFVRVRTARKIEGWVDERMLLSTQEMEALRRLAEESRVARSQGVASTYESLNVHTAPDRQSPSFLQVKEKERVDVIGHRVTPRVSAPAPAPPPPPVVTKRKVREKKSKEIPPPPLPAAPKLPADWQRLSTSIPAAPPPPPAEPKPVPTDDWSLIRNAAGQTGWVLTRRLYMAIPDEVAQYAEGRRIVSYFPLGDTRDGTVTKPSWLWTTIESGQQPYDFDSFRVFVWSLRHHRYETGHIERNVKGFFPVITGPVPAPRARATKDAAPNTEKAPGFSILVEKKDGLRYRRNFAFIGNQVRFSGEERADSSPSEQASKPTLIASEKTPPPVADSFYGNLKQRIKSLFGR